MPGGFRDALLASLLELLAGATRRQVAQVLVAQLAQALPDSRVALVAGDAQPDARDPNADAAVSCTRGPACLLGMPARAADGEAAAAAWCRACRATSAHSRAVRALSGGALVLDVPLPAEPSLLPDIDRMADTLDRAFALIEPVPAASARRREPGEAEALTRELHDSVAQQLGFMSLLVGRLQQGARTDPVLTELRAMTTRLQRQVRELITSARLTLDGRSLQQALADSVAEFSRRCDVVFELDNRLPALRLDSATELHILQIVREALSNVVRHAQAQHAWIDLRASRAGFRVSVTDDGVGLVPGAVGENHHGLNILHERARAIGASLTIGGGASGGTCVNLFVPGETPEKAPR